MGDRVGFGEEEVIPYMLGLGDSMSYSTVSVCIENGKQLFMHYALPGHPDLYPEQGTAPT